MTYDWGDRQQRVDYLLKRLRSLPPDKVIKGGTLTASEMISAIENGTLDGRGFVATAGFVFQAMAATPERFRKDEP